MPDIVIITTIKEQIYHVLVGGNLFRLVYWSFLLTASGFVLISVLGLGIAAVAVDYLLFISAGCPNLAVNTSYIVQ